ncbi:aminotransferase class V-fold PLP-dependent enzyme [Spongiimicrobium salis]|uniref:aminotransferase class V-fold PLP-dependent enzyme n=1 Tax=Spongiimicrobium salis TaxID=1667022 RepID=UPI00374CFB5C
MLSNQRHLFSLPSDITYLNGAYMAPQLKSTEDIGIHSLKRKSRPHTLTSDDFFKLPQLLKEGFAALVDAPDPSNMAIIPSVSYGIANVAANIKLNKGDEILMVDEQFPSNVYSWKRLAERDGAHLKIVKPIQNTQGRGASWNKAILEAINERTAVVAMCHVHWADGTLFDLKRIRQETKAVDALLILDGTQSIGALPFSVQELQPDALICAGYKWLMGPYSMGVAYFGDYFDHGTPIEDNWINRMHSEDFSALTHYQEAYQPKAGRYSVGEGSNFVLVPMLTDAIDQLLEWGPEHIQSYCDTISKPLVAALRTKGYFVEEDAYRAKHLFGVYLPEGTSLEALKKKLADKNVYVSFRGNAVRVSMHLYTTKEDLETLLSCF